MTYRRCILPMLFVITSMLLTACQSPCERAPADGYTRYRPESGNFELGFDYPSSWSMSVDHTLHQTDPLGLGRSVLMEIKSEPVEKYPHIYSGGKMISDQEWGSPFPGRAMTIESRDLMVGGFPAMSVAYDFEAPLTLMDGTSPVTSWGYMQFTFIAVGERMYTLRFYASADNEQVYRKEFDKFVKSICILPGLGIGND